MIRDVMKIKTATFAQDNNAGTTTTLECVAPWGLLDNINANVGAPKKSSVAPAPSPDVPPTIQPAPTGSQPPPTTPPVEIPPFPIQPGGA
jgi:hypothetical protein